MTKPALRKICLFLALIPATFTLSAQPKESAPTEISSSVKTKKPYRILTNGKRITVSATSGLRKLMVWTASGHRMVEQNNLDGLTYSFDVVTREKILFILIEFADGRRFTDKIGVK